MDKKSVLIIRPKMQAEVFSKKLRAFGISTDVQPMLDIRSVSFDVPDLGTYQGLIFTSANGVQFFADQSDERDISVYTVGEQTDRAACMAGYGERYCARGAAEDLFQLIQGKAVISSGGLLHVRGRDIAYPFEEKLRSLEYDARSVIVYEAVQCASFSEDILCAFEKGRIQAVTFFSRRTAQAFMGAADKVGLSGAFGEIKALCISESVLNYVQQFDWQGVYVADTPDQDGMVKLANNIAVKNNYFWREKNEPI